MKANYSLRTGFAVRAVAQVFAAVSLFFIAAGVQAAAISKVVLNDGSTLALSNPRHAVDADGNIHIAVQGQAANSPGQSVELYYMLVEPNGNVLIDATKINNPDGSRDGRPEVVILPDGRAVITWFGNSETMRYVLVDPTGDDQDGDAANPADILDRTETALGANTGRGHHSTAVDSSGVVHVAACRGDQLRYTSFNPVTNTIVTADVVRGSCESRVRPAIGLDSNDDVHILMDGATGNRAASYQMLDGANGSVLIAPTQLFDGAISPKAAHLSLMVDEDDIVHIVYGDKRNTVDAGDWCDECSQNGTAIYTQLDPSLDDQNGNAAVIDTIRTIDEEVELGGLWYGQAFMDGSVIHLIAPNGKGGDLIHVGVSKTSGAVIFEPRVYTAQIGGQGWSRHYASGVGDRVIWAEGVFSAPLSNGTFQLVMASADSFAERENVVEEGSTASDDDDGFLGALGLVQLLALVLGAGLMRRRVRR